MHRFYTQHSTHEPSRLHVVHAVSSSPCLFWPTHERPTSDVLIGHGAGADTINPPLSLPIENSCEPRDPPQLVDFIHKIREPLIFWTERGATIKLPPSRIQQQQQQLASHSSREQIIVWCCWLIPPQKLLIFPHGKTKENKTKVTSTLSYV